MAGSDFAVGRTCREGFYAPPACHDITENRTGISRPSPLVGIYLRIDGGDVACRRGVKPLPTRYPTGKARPINCAIPEMRVSLSLERMGPTLCLAMVEMTRKREHAGSRRGRGKGSGGVGALRRPWLPILFS